MKPEEKVKAEIKAKLKELGAYFFMPVQTGFGTRTVDILACLDGRFIGVEVKRADGKGVLTDMQRSVLAAIRRAGGLAVVATSWDDVREIIGELT